MVVEYFDSKQVQCSGQYPYAIFYSKCGSQWCLVTQRLSTMHSEQASHTLKPKYTTRNPKLRHSRDNSDEKVEKSDTVGIFKNHRIIYLVVCSLNLPIYWGGGGDNSWKGGYLAFCIGFSLEEGQGRWKY